MNFGANKTSIEIIKKGAVEEHFLETFILVLMESRTKSHGNNSVN